MTVRVLSAVNLLIVVVPVDSLLSDGGTSSLVKISLEFELSSKPMVAIHPSDQHYMVLAMSESICSGPPGL